MESIGVGAGLGAIGFWVFVAIVVVAGIWNGICKREAQHETLRRMVDSGRAIEAPFPGAVEIIVRGNRPNP